MRSRANHNLKHPKLRQTWNKYNLYNLSRARDPQTLARTFFQQKWTAKAISRSYHGERVREGMWKRLFSRRLHSVVPMDARYLARNDGTAESAGRGSGLEPAPGSKPRSLPNIPYMQMTYAPLERRLDTAIFRAMFASSAGQARQFVVHGQVTVNGKKMRHPGYLLNPGDMFQVDPERVMFAAGAPKDRVERRDGRVRRRLGKGEAEEAKAKREAEFSDSLEEETTREEDPRETLKNLLNHASGIMSTHRNSLPAKRKQDFRAFRTNVRRLLSRSGSSAVLTENLEEQFSQLKATLKDNLNKAAESEKPQSAPASESSPSESESSQSSPAQPEQSPQQTPPEPSAAPSAPSAPSANDSGPSPALTQAFAKASLNPSAPPPTENLSDTDLSILQQAMHQLRDNPIDSTKPYATPWRPRDYMSAFAFIPRYLEVNPNICAAVYVRHPVARPGHAEVPTPYSDSVNGTAFAWYLRRR